MKVGLLQRGQAYMGMIRVPLSGITWSQLQNGPYSTWFSRATCFENPAYVASRISVCAMPNGSPKIGNQSAPKNLNEAFG